MIRLRKKRDKDFIIECMSSEVYKKYFSFLGEIQNINFKRRKIYIIQNEKEKVGFIEYYHWDKCNSNISVNILALKTGFIIGKALLNSAYIAFEKFKVHKLIIKVHEENIHMGKILRKLKIPLEGKLKMIDGNNSFFYIYLYGLLKNEYLTIKENINK
jgi:RimJ/RimL family protein N-acetyltransferase